MITLRDTLISSDSQAVRRIVEATAMFRPNEVAVAVELVDECLSKGADTSGYHFILADDDKTPIGYVCFGRITVTLHSYDLYWIVVDPIYQGHGLGRQLLVAAEQRIQADGGQQIYIETSGQEVYRSTCHFYDRCGYELVATIPDFYAPGDDKLIYVRRFV